MTSSIIGIDIGTNEIKLVVLEKGRMTEAVRERLPRDLVQNGQITSFDALGEFIGTVCKEHKLSPKKCALLLPNALNYVRHITMPMMKESHLRLNLPYEFHDFIQDDKDKYVFDFAVLGTRTTEDGGEVLELMAAAAKKEVIANYTSALRMAGKKLVMVKPAVMALADLLPIPEEGEEGQEYCFINLGHSSTRVHIFCGRDLVATKVIEYGLQMLDQVVAEEKGVDIYIASTYKESNYENVLEAESCQNLYHAIAVEIMRAINFYRFNHPESRLSDAYLCGGGAKIKSLADIIAEQTELTLLSPALLLEDYAMLNDGDAALFACALGTAME